MEKIHSKYYDLIARQLHGELSKTEEKELLLWVNADSENKKVFDEIMKLWDAAADSTEDYNPDAEAGWQRFMKNIESEKSQKQKSNVRWFSPFNPLIKAAAIFILFLGIIYLMKLYYGNPPANQQAQVIIQKTKEHQKKVLYLPDSSKVILNHNSELSYSDHFNVNDRIVELKGEAFFEVKKAGGKPFTIYSGESKTQVIGTSFNVRTTDNNKKIEVIVVTGKVAFSFRNENVKTKLLLEPGTKGVINVEDHSIIKSKNDDPNFMAWENNSLKFDNTPMKDVMATLENYFNVKMTAGSNGILNCRFTGTFDKPDLNEILSVFAVSMNITAKHNNGQYTLYGKPCE